MGSEAATAKNGAATYVSSYSNKPLTQTYHVGTHLNGNFTKNNMYLLKESQFLPTSISIIRIWKGTRKDLSINNLKPILSCDGDLFLWRRISIIRIWKATKKDLSINNLKQFCHVTETVSIKTDFYNPNRKLHAYEKMSMHDKWDCLQYTNHNLFCWL